MATDRYLPQAVGQPRRQAGFLKRDTHPWRHFSRTHNNFWRGHGRAYPAECGRRIRRIYALAGRDGKALVQAAGKRVDQEHETVKYAKALSDGVKAVYVALDIMRQENLRKNGRITQGGEYPNGVITVVMPEFVPLKCWHHLLHNQTALPIKGKLLFKKDVVSTSVPLRLQR